MAATVPATPAPMIRVSVEKGVEDEPDDLEVTTIKRSGAAFS
jgi:hypothetical protein